MPDNGYNIYLFTYSKKKNSTASPANNTGIRYRCYLNNSNKGILNPTVIIDLSGELSETFSPGYNYASIPEFRRKYYISDIRYNKGLWELDLTVDVLASWKSYIGSLSTYILRSASNYDRYITDNMYPVKVGSTFNATTQNSNPFATSFSAGYFVAGIINGDSSGYGAVNYYVFTSAEFRAFANYLLGNTSIYNVDDISSQLLKVIYNPFQYVVSCTWLPVAPPMGAAVSSISIGWWSVTCSAHRLSGSVRASGTVTITIPRHPEGANNQYLYAEPYTQYYLEFPPFGAFTIPANHLVNASYVDFAWSCDCITGEGKLSMGAGNAAQPFNIVHGMVGVPIQLAQMTPDVIGAIQQMVPQSGSKVVDSVINTLGAIGSAYVQSQLPMQTTGGTGGFMAGYYPIKLTGIFLGIVPQNLAEFGAPCCKTLTINTLSGYVQCANPVFNGPCYDSEKEEINGYLTGGFFYE